MLCARHSFTMEWIWCCWPWRARVSVHRVAVSWAVWESDGLHVSHAVQLCTNKSIFLCWFFMSSVVGRRMANGRVLFHRVRNFTIKHFICKKKEREFHLESQSQSKRMVSRVHQTMWLAFVSWTWTISMSASAASGAHEENFLSTPLGYCARWLELDIIILHSAPVFG